MESSCSLHKTYKHLISSLFLVKCLTGVVEEDTVFFDLVSLQSRKEVSEGG